MHKQLLFTLKFPAYMSIDIYGHKVLVAQYGSIVLLW